MPELLEAVTLYLDDVMISDTVKGGTDEYWQYLPVESMKYDIGKRYAGFKDAKGDPISLTSRIDFDVDTLEARVYTIWEYTRINIDGQILEDIANAVRVVFDEDTSVTYKPQKIAEKLLKYK